MKTIAIGIWVQEQPERLRATLSMLRAHTAPAARVLLLGDGPDAATRALLRDGRDLPHHSTTDEPLGAPACFNRLLRSAPADLYVLLESGALPGPGWLEIMLAALAADPGAGLAGPSTNRAWNEQALFAGAGGGQAEIARCASAAWRRFGAAARTLEPLYSLADFCYAVRREVVEAIGGADEGFGPGPCWEMEYSARAARAGWRGLWVQGAYVYRSPFTPRRARNEAAHFEASRRRYQDTLCGLRLRGLRTAADTYEPHCRGDACEHFAPSALIRSHIALGEQWTGRLGERETGNGSRAVSAGESDGVALSSPAHQSPSPLPPLVSCIMPTRGRPDFVQQSIAYFARQDYPARELIIVDEPGAPPPAIPPALAAAGAVRGLHAPSNETIGAKRNRAIEAARGAYIAQWDDDDWYAPGRLSAQMAPLLAGSADISALKAGLFFDLPRWQFWNVSPDLHRRLFLADVHGGTLVYRRSLWEQGARYPLRSLAEDAALLREAMRRGARLAALPNDGLFVYLRHATNSWAFRCGQHIDPAGWRPAAEPPFPPADRAFYAARSAIGAASSLSGAPSLHTDPLQPRPATPDPRPAPAAPDSPLAAQPLVSCIMPTAERRALVPQAIAHFLRQTYAPRELIVVDDGRDAVADLIPPHPQIRYIRLDRRHTIGAKRNIACRHAHGDIIAHWDDDDWMAAWRLEYQVARLLAGGADGNGLARLYFYDATAAQAWLYDYPAGAGRPWVAGATLVYRRAAWARAPFPDVDVGEDARFVWGGALRALDALPNPDFYVARIHPGNTAPKQRRPPYWSPWTGDLHALTQGELGATAAA